MGNRGQNAQVCSVPRGAVNPVPFMSMLLWRAQSGGRFLWICTSLVCRKVDSTSWCPLRPSWLPAAPQHHPALPWQQFCSAPTPICQPSLINREALYQPIHLLLWHQDSRYTMTMGSKVCPVQPSDGKSSCWASWGMSPWRELLWAPVSAVTQHIIPLDLWTYLLLSSLLQDSTAALPVLPAAQIGGKRELLNLHTAVCNIWRCLLNIDCCWYLV